MAKKRKYPDTQSLLNPPQETKGFTAAERSKVAQELTKASEGFTAVAHSRYGSSDFSNLGPDISGTPGLRRADYEEFRPDERIPTKRKDIVKVCDRVYQQVGLVKNIIDLMSDFASKGVRLVHRNMKQQRFFQHWFETVGGKNLVERALNNLYRTGTVIVNRQDAYINFKTEEVLSRRAIGGEIEVEIDKALRRTIPWRYTLLDPCTVTIIGQELAAFVGQPKYALELPEYIKRLINNPPGPAEKELVAKLPDDVKAAAKSGKPYPLDEQYISVMHYKKDDWQLWAYPMIYAILDDIFALEKLKLADITALDGAISKLRILKLGDHKLGIVPTPELSQKLAELVQNNVGGGTSTLIWSSDIELLETSTDAHQFLGEDKYKPTYNAIYAGLGIPPTLTGTFGAAGTTNNFVSLKTLTERLQYGRDIIVKFLNKEIRRIQEAMNFRYPAIVEFDYMALGNDDAEKSLLIQLADRNLISDELLQHRFGQNPDAENYRLMREHKQREKGMRVPKASQWHDPQVEVSLKKIFAQAGAVTPSEVGLELEEKKSGEKSALQMQVDVQKQKMAQKSTGIPGQGRPKGKKDSKKRKTKVVRPRGRAALNAWAARAQAQIAEISNPMLLNFFNKKDMRSLTESEFEQAEYFKFGVLYNMMPYSMVNEDTVKLAMSEGIPATVYNEYVKYITNYETKAGRLTLKDKHSIQAYFYTVIKGPQDE